MSVSSGTEARWQLYRLLAEPFRLRLLALAAEEELTLGELAELMHESQPNVSRHAAPLRQAGLLAERRHGTRTFVHFAEDADADAVVADALSTGRALCRDDRSLARVAEIVRQREARTREFFAHPGQLEEPSALAAELPAYLFALRALLPERALAVDAGIGDGAWLDVLCPLFERVLGIDRSSAQLGRAKQRAALRGYPNLTLLCAELGDELVRRAVGNGADVVVASRMLHHAPKPRALLRSLVELLRPGGHLVLVDYQRHADEAFGERQADVWHGFEAEELEGYARAAGLVGARVAQLPAAWVQSPTDGHVGWQVLVAQRPAEPPGERAPRS